MMNRATISPSAMVAQFSHIDRRMALSFGMLLTVLVFCVVLVSGWQLRGIMERDQARFFSMTTQVLIDAVGRVSFSGKYQVRIFLEKLQREQPDFSYVRLINPAGIIEADTHSANNDSALDMGEKSYIAPVLSGKQTQLIRLQQTAAGPIREITVAYRIGFDDSVQGVIQVGISEAETQAALQRLMALVGVLLLVLLVTGIGITLALSRHFGRPVRELATILSNESERLDNTLEALHAGTWEWSVQTGAVAFNERWAQIVGYTLNELRPLTEQTFAQLCHPDDLSHSRKQIDAHLAGLTDRYSCEARMRHKLGHWVWVLDSGHLVKRDAQGRPVKMLGTRQDITARKHAEENYRQQSEKFIALARVSNTGVWEYDDTKHYLWCSIEYFSMLGRDYSDYENNANSNLENTWGSLLHPDDKAEAMRRFADYLAAGSQGMYESAFRMLHADGSWVHIISRGSTLRDANGNPTDKTLGTHINITNLKMAEAGVREGQERLQRISDNLPNSMVYQLDCGPLGATRCITYISQGVQRMHGLSVDEVLCNAALLYQQVLPEDLERLLEHERECITKMKDFKIEVRAILPDGRLRWFMLISTPRCLENHHYIFDGIEVDITEHKLQEEKIQELNASLERRVQERTAALKSALDDLKHTQNELLQNEKLASLGALVAGVSHELNTPIGNSVTVASTLVRNHHQFTTSIQTGITRTGLQRYLDDVLEGAQIIERNLGRAAELIGGFKQLAVDQTSYQRRSFALMDLVHEVEISMRPLLKKTKFQWVQDIPADLVLDSLPGPLGQVLINLINNALIHAFDGREHGSITLRAQAEERPGWLQLSVCDDGCGIAPEDQGKVFDPFFTSKMGQGGSGLGLHIIYTLVTGLLGGTVELKSALGQGSCFTVHLPLVAPETPVASEAIKAKDPAGT